MVDSRDFRPPQLRPWSLKRRWSCSLQMHFSHKICDSVHINTFSHNMTKRMLYYIMLYIYIYILKMDNIIHKCICKLQDRGRDLVLALGLKTWPKLIHPRSVTMKSEDFYWAGDMFWEHLVRSVVVNFKPKRHDKKNLLPWGKHGQARSVQRIPSWPMPQCWWMILNRDFFFFGLQNIKQIFLRKWSFRLLEHLPSGNLT